MSSIADLLAQGEAYRLAGQWQLAEQTFRQAIQADPSNHVAYGQLGLVVAQQGRLDAAITYFQSALERNPNYSIAHNNLGVAWEQMGKLDAAVASYRRAVQAWPDYAAAHCNLGTILEKQGKLDEAVASCRRAVELNPDNVNAHNGLGVALVRQGKLDEAAAALRRVLQLQPDYAEAHSNLAGMFDRQGKLDEAAASLVRALELKPNSPEMHINLGLVLGRQGKRDQATATFRRAIDLDPGCALAHLNYGLALLRDGRFEEGCREYEWRTACEGPPPPTFHRPRWHGESLENKTILLVEEQGLGDTLHFVRYAEPLKSRGATVIVRCREQLVSLLARYASIDAVIASTSALPPYDVYLPLPSAPGVVGTSLASIPANVPYLSADEALVRQWKDELAGVDALKVGINWQGDPNHMNDWCRSIPLAKFAALAGLSGVQLYSLQWGQGREQLSTWTPARPIVDLGDRLGDFHNMAAILRNLDVLITCDSAPAHLAGALGVPVWAALTIVADWRWLDDRADSPWYPTMRLYRQSRADDWDEVFRRIAADLAALARQREQAKGG